LEQNAKIQKQMQLVKEQEAQARKQLEEAQRQADILTSKAAFEFKEAENAEKVIVTVRNKDGQVLEIKSLEELSKEKLQEMGFDLEILKPKGN
jgi:hypothetical protein